MTSPRGSSTGTGSPDARVVTVDGIVQGVGFRPFVWRLATELGLDGSVRNLAGRVEIVVAGDPAALATFADRIAADAPPRARVERVSVAPLPPDVARPTPGGGFVIDESVAAASAERLFPPDIATCDDCVRELWDPADRRYRYPFINCTNCGPRATIIDELPYDRARTSMREFPLCADCEREYRDPADRRFHAEPVACAACGPRLAYRTTGAAAPTAREEGGARRRDRGPRGRADRRGQGARAATTSRATRPTRRPWPACATGSGAGRSRSRSWSATSTRPGPSPTSGRPRRRSSRRRRARSSSLAWPPRAGRRRRRDGIRRSRSGDERRPARRPLPARTRRSTTCSSAAIDRPIVLTSGNLSDEPLVTDDAEALRPPRGHRRRLPPARPPDPGPLRRFGHARGRPGASARESVIRRGRGYAPDPLDLPVASPGPAPRGRGGAQAHVHPRPRPPRARRTPHRRPRGPPRPSRVRGEPRAPRAAARPRAGVGRARPPSRVPLDAVRGRPLPRRRAGSRSSTTTPTSRPCAAEHGITGPFIGVAYDGLGMGDDGTFWGGEILVADLAGYRRVARFGLAPMPGGRARRAEAVPDGARLPLRGRGRGAGRPSARRSRRSSPPRLPRPARPARGRGRARPGRPAASTPRSPRRAGRLFDAVSSLLGLRDVAEYEAQAAIDLENVAADRGARGAAPVPHRPPRRAPRLRPATDARGAARAASPPATPRALGSRRGSTRRSRRSRASSCARGAPRPPGSTSSASPAASSRTSGSRTRSSARLARGRLRGPHQRRSRSNDGGISYGQAAVAAARLAADDDDPPSRSASGASPSDATEGGPPCASASPARSSRSTRRPASGWAASTSAACARRPAWPTSRRSSSATTSSSTSGFAISRSTRRRRCRRSRCSARWAT